MKAIALLLALSVAPIATAQILRTGESDTLSLRYRGDEALERGDFTSALEDYRRCLEATHGNDPGLLKKIATLHQWMREYTEAKEVLGTVIARNRSDEEAVAALQRMQNSRGLQLSGAYGEGEIDYTTSTYALGASYGGVDWLDLHAGFSKSSKLVYDRSSLWLDAYMFPSYRTYVRFGIQQKEYTYPFSFNAVPDNNAYSHVPDYQLEVGYYYFRENYFSLEAEYFTPGFYWNNGLHANNYKMGGTIRNWIARPVYAKVFVATLHDPDPQSVVTDQATNAISGFGYENITLLGGAVGFDNDRVNMEIKYVPDRDLDRSLNWSLFSTLRVNADAFSVQYDFLYDKYPSSVARGFSSSQVHMFTAIVEPAMSFEMKIGVKTLIRDVTRIAPFLSLQLRTGV